MKLDYQYIESHKWKLKFHELLMTFKTVVSSEKEMF